MALPLVLGAIAAGSSLFKLIKGIDQGKKSRQSLAEYNQQQEARPQYGTPDEAMRILAMARQRYGDPTMPGQGAMLDRAGQNFSNTVQAGVQGGNPFAVLSAAQSQYQQGSQNIGVQSAQYQDQRYGEYVNALNMMSGYRDQEWQLNEFAPWKDKTQMALNQYRDYRQAAGQNVMGGLDGLSTIALSMMAPSLNPTSDGADPMSLQSIFQRYNQPPATGNTLPPPPY